MSSNLNKSRELFYQKLKKIYILQGIEALLDWDHQVMMPESGATFRAEQLSLISSLKHKETTSKSFIKLMSKLRENIDNFDLIDRTNIRETERVIERQAKLPATFVSNKAKICAKSFSAWTDAKRSCNFKAVEPFLSSIVELSIQEAHYVGFNDSPYQALFDVYEPGVSWQKAKETLISLGEELIPVIRDIKRRESNAIPKDLFSQSEVYSICKQISADLGFDSKKGRLDSSAHPFQTTIGTGDFRLTTRYKPENILDTIYSVIHETGHAIYEQGLPETYHGTPMGSAASLGVHESQSRFFENMIGRSRAFSEYLYRKFAEVNLHAAKSVSPQSLWENVTNVAPSLIRVEADEVTYSLHIIIRFILEEALLTKDLSVRDLPSAWNDLYEKYLGVRPSNDADGVLQDVHWYSGSIGYFPTYALGNIFAGMLFSKLQSKYPDMDSRIRKGDFTFVKEWLGDNIHSKGMLFPSIELVEGATDASLSSEPFMNYIKDRYLNLAVPECR